LAGRPIREEVLSDALGETPVLCPDAKAAKLFADVCHPNPPDDSGLPFNWLDRDR
jgi:hypothetical protein